MNKLRNEDKAAPRSPEKSGLRHFYINHNIHAGDNGRVVGYDNAHDGHHRHYFGAVEPIEFVSFEDTEERFEQDWIALKDSK